MSAGRVAALVVRGYQLVIRPLLPSVCRFEPGCSEYARQALAGRAIDALHAQRPCAESDDVVVGLCVGLHLEPPFDAEHAADAAQDDPLPLSAHCGIAGRARP